MIAGVKRPCVTCGTLTEGLTYCEPCRLERERKRSARRGRRHYTGDYARRARAVRESASQCWICGEGARPDDPWTADHVLPGDPASPLLPAHRSCNSRRGSRSIDEMRGRAGE